MEIIKVLAFYLAGCIVAKIMLNAYKIDKNEHSCACLSWVVVIVLLIRGK